MVNNEDLSGHKTWRLIYGVLFFINLIYSPTEFGATVTGILAILIAFLYWGQQKSIDDIENQDI